METLFHSVTLDTEKCVGCTNCIKHCPTEAIRVRGGKATILSQRCIDCGECIRVCPHHAKKARHDSLDILQNFQYTVALPAPALFGQFNNLDDIDIILTGLLELGFDSVFEVSRAAEIVSDATRRLMAEGKLKKPVISSACPAVVRLIQVRFPHLCDHVLPMKSPMEVAAALARQRVMAQTGLSPDEIGIIFISPCPAKVTDVRLPIGSDRSQVDGVLSISNIYPQLVHKMDHLTHVDPLFKSGLIGVSWSFIGGEAAGLLNENHLSADGIQNVIKVLEELEDDKLADLDFIELNACSGGCVGGVFTAENGYVARARIKRLRKYMPVSCNRADDVGDLTALQWNRPLEENPALKLADNIEDAMRLMQQADEVFDRLPNLDCGSCGAPSCRALAGDVALGQAQETDCIFLMRQQIQEIASRLAGIGQTE
ncbi:MAG: 4Fe-4S binding protein [Clostridia bacterium]|nr:4Fe-4S binding protein [Clostridia bacterium]